MINFSPPVVWLFVANTLSNEKQKLLRHYVLFPALGNNWRNKYKFQDLKFLIVVQVFLVFEHGLDEN